MLQKVNTPAFTSVLIGNESLLVGCGNQLLDRQLPIAAVITDNPDIRRWAADNGLVVDRLDKNLAGRLAAMPFDWLFSIANLMIIPESILQLAAKGSINFHDGPLPRYAGVNAPVWALLNDEPRHGVTWHMIEGGIDEGDILERRLFDIAADDTAFSLNAKCYAAGLESFASLISNLTLGKPARIAQNLSARSYFARDQLPAADGLLDFRVESGAFLTQIRALDHGKYFNPLCCPKIAANGRLVLVGTASLANVSTQSEPGTVLDNTEKTITVATGSTPVILSDLCDVRGRQLPGTEIAIVGQVIEYPTNAAATALSAAMKRANKGQSHWQIQLRLMRPIRLPYAGRPTRDGRTDTHRVSVPADFDTARMTAAVSIWAMQSCGGEANGIALRTSETKTLQDLAPGHLNGWLPLIAGSQQPGTTVDDLLAAATDQLANAHRYPAYALDLTARDPQIEPNDIPDIGINYCDDMALEGAVVTVACTGSTDSIVLHFDAARVGKEYQKLLVGRLARILERLAESANDLLTLDASEFLPDAERALLLQEWNRTETGFDRDQTIHGAIEAQTSRSPKATALVFEDQKLDYATLNARANQVAHVLRDMGVSRGAPVGLCTRRSVEMVVAALGILKAGGAYVPLDRSYPEDRLRHYLDDSGAPVVVTQSDLAADLPSGNAALINIDTDTRIADAPTDNPGPVGCAEDMAYLIYTSGSTGTPKGVMVSHRNVTNFFAGMDARIECEGQGVWLALTSLAFDISVLELFYTLARGFKLVLSDDTDRALVSNHPIRISDKIIDFSLFYWGNDDGPGPRKYEMLLEGAKFADANGFRAVWTPERHFHAFGGPYPNPSVTGAAVAAVTKNLDVRAGSCVTPLHHPARIAEEWAVIDNLTNGRAGLAVASGWQPNDFVLRPQNTPPNNKKAMFNDIDTLRRLWRGEAVEFPQQSGETLLVLTQPRPVSKELPIWVTTAGNPETWKEAGAIGANVLTHLLGQSIDEVSAKIAIYHKALRDAGHDPKNHTVTLMLHTFVGEDRETVREIARAPMKEYLRSAAGLIKQYAWVFPAFKRPVGVDNAFDMDLETLSEEELDAILDFAFLRYFEESGLFGTVQDCLDRVEQLKRIGVGEVACLIDYGIPSDIVLDGLKPLAEVLKKANAEKVLDDDDYSIAAQILRHDVTHLQCTPTLARMIAMNDEARFALARLKQVLIGGETFPVGLPADLRAATDAQILNMYGPTETTIWSAVDTVDPEKPITIGTPIANTSVYVLDDELRPVPVGVPGELFIGGEGVTDGYWKRDALTAERFPSNPFSAFGRARMYRTGDLARWRPDGRLDFLGRTDHQVKIRGHRIEPGEIETALCSLPGIRDAAVVPHTAKTGDTALLGFVTANAQVDAAGLRAELARLLPAHMVPVQIAVLDSFPMTPNRKIDRMALAAIKPQSQPARDIASPKEGTQAKIAAIWTHVLGAVRINAGDNFFALGGHSLLAVQAHRELRSAFPDARLSVTDIFALPVLRALAARIEGDTGSQVARDSPQVAEADRSVAVSKRKAMRARRALETG